MHYREKIVSDLWGPVQVKSLGGVLYLYTNIDLYTHQECIMFLLCKSDTFKAYCAYEAWVWVYQGAQIKIDGIDGGSKFTSTEIKPIMPLAPPVISQYMTHCSLIALLNMQIVPLSKELEQWWLPQNFSKISGQKPNTIWFSYKIDPPAAHYLAT